MCDVGKRVSVMTPITGCDVACIVYMWPYILDVFSYIEARISFFFFFLFFNCKFISFSLEDNSFFFFHLFKTTMRYHYMPLRMAAI